MVTGSAALADYRKCPRRSTKKGKGRERATPDLWSDTTASNSTVKVEGVSMLPRSVREEPPRRSAENDREARYSPHQQRTKNGRELPLPA